MTLRIPAYVSLSCLAMSGLAWGQAPSSTAKVDVSVGYQGLPSKTPSNVQSGVQLSEGAVMHLGVGAEAGYDTNVFYGETDPRGSAIVRVVPFLELTNATRGGAAPSDVFFDLGAALTYREYLSNDALIRQQRALMPSAYGNLEFSRAQAMSFGLTESFSRTEDPPYLNTNSNRSFIRDVNQASARLRLTPGGGRLSLNVGYTNTIDWFETDALRVANSMGHLLVLDTSWKWLPKTALVLQVSQGYISYFKTDNGANKPTSFPFHALAGLRGLISAKLTVNLLVGYANGFYDTVRPGPSGFRGNFSAIGEANYSPTILTNIGLGYRHDFANAILGDYYYVDAVYLNVGQAIAGRVGFGLSARYESRSFQNIHLVSTNSYVSRHDNYVQVGVNLDYHIREWTYAGVAYTVMSNTSDYEQMSALDPGRVNYLKQMMFARLGVTY